MLKPLLHRHRKHCSGLNLSLSPGCHLGLLLALDIALAVVLCLLTFQLGEKVTGGLDSGCALLLSQGGLLDQRHTDGLRFTLRLADQPVELCFQEPSDLKQLRSLLSWTA